MRAKRTDIPKKIRDSFVLGATPPVHVDGPIEKRLCSAVPSRKALALAARVAELTAPYTTEAGVAEKEAKDDAVSTKETGSLRPIIVLLEGENETAIFKQVADMIIDGSWVPRPLWHAPGFLQKKHLGPRPGFSSSHIGSKKAK